MLISTDIGASEVIAVSPRAALREKLLKIIGLAPRSAVDAEHRPEMLRKPQWTGCWVLLLDQRVDHLDVQQLVESVCRSYPQVAVAFIENERNLIELPCEFGDGRPLDRHERESPVGRAAAAHWRRIERVFSVRAKERI